MMRGESKIKKGKRGEFNFTPLFIDIRSYISWLEPDLIVIGSNISHSCRN